MIPECYLDTNLIEYLMQGTVNHQHCCNKVVGTLKDKFSNRFAIGIIDKDKVQVGYLNDCVPIAQTKHLCVWKHKGLPHYLITVSPAIDRFLLDCAKDEGIRPEDYNLPSQLKEFIKRSKKTTSNKDSDFRNLIKAIRSHSEIKALGKTLRYLQTNEYNSDIAVVKSFF